MPQIRSSRTAIVHEINPALVKWFHNARLIESEECNGPLEVPSIIRRISWSAYQSFLGTIVCKGLRHSYRDGTLELMAPRTFWRESRKSIVRRFAQHLSCEFQIRLTSLGRVPISAPLQRIGLEPDEAFRVTLHSRTSVTPNLVIEVSDSGSNSKSAALDEHVVSRLWLLRELGIQEVWLVRGSSITILANQEKRRWHKSPDSQIFLGVSSAILSKNLARSRDSSENDAIRHLLYDVHAKMSKTATQKPNTSPNS